MKILRLILRFAVGAMVVPPSLAATSGAGVALVRHAPALNHGTLDGSLQQLRGETLTLNGGAVITGDLLVPGTPTIRVNGQSLPFGIADGGGNAEPSNYQVTMNGGVRLRGIIRRTDPGVLPALAAPPAPLGTRAVRLAGGSDAPVDFAMLRDLTLQAGAGQIAVPPGTYGDFTAEGGSGFTLGIAGSTQPTLYNFQRLTLGSQTQLQVVGPIIVIVAYAVVGHGTMGSVAHPEWFDLSIYSGGLTLNGGCTLHGFVKSPHGGVVVNGNSELIGGVACDRLTVNGGIVRLVGVEPGNRAPIAIPSAASIIEDTSATLTLAATDYEGDALTYAIVAPPSHGTLGAITPGPNHTATVVYTPAPNATEPVVFTFMAQDGKLESNHAIVRVTIVPVNDGPTADAKSLTGVEDMPLNLVLTGGDVDGDALRFEIVAPPVHGVLNGTGSHFTYTPRLDFHGSDLFTFVAEDGALTSAPAAITITVTPVNDEPVALNSSHSVNEGSVVAVAMTGFDPDGDALTFERLWGPANGSVTGDGSQFTYIPAANFNGIDQITFRAFDGQLYSAPGTLTFHVTDLNFPPVAQAGVVVTEEDTSIVVPLVATDEDGHAMTYTIVGPPGAGLLGPVMTGPNNTATVVYTPATNMSGEDTFTFKARDLQSADSNVATVSITVRPVNDPPVAHVQAAQTDEDTVVPMTLTAADVENTPLQFLIVAPPKHGTLSALSVGALNTATVNYIPSRNFFGIDTFAFIASDGEAESTPALVTVTVRAVNDAPVAEAQVLSTNEDESATLVLKGVDVEGGALTFAIVAPPLHGTLGSVVAGPDNTVSVIYTPAPDYYGTDGFTFKVHDGERDSEEARVSLVMTPVNDAPVATDQNLIQLQGTAFDFTLSAYDVDGDPLTYNFTPPPRGVVTGTAPNLHFAPAPDESGTLILRFTASDGVVTSNEATIAFTLTAPPNRPPVFASSPVTNLEVRGENGGPGMLRGTIRDFSKQHPNFEHYNFSSTQVSTGVVAAWLGADRKPVPATLGGMSSTDTVENFNQWYRDVPGVNFSRKIDLPVTETFSGSGLFSFRSDAFFPIDNEFFGSEELTDGVLPHNFNFTCEFHSHFVYQAGQSIMFGGDDSIWVFVADRRVIDLGGVHLPVEQTTSLDHLGLIPGQVYPIDIFYAEQHTGGASFRFRTNFGLSTLETYGYGALAIDPDGDPVAYTLLQAPAGMTIDAQSGAVNWLVGEADIGNHPIVIEARDPGGLAAVQSFAVNVVTNRPPAVTVERRFLAGATGVSVPLAGSVSDDGYPVGSGVSTKWTVLSGPGTVQLQSADTADTSATFSAPGLYVLRLSASDGSRIAETTLEVRIDHVFSVFRESSLVSWWPGNRTTDDVYGQHHASLYFGAAYEAGKVGDAFRFESGDAVARVLATPDLNIGASSQGFTIEFWVRCDEPRPEAVLLAWQAKGGELGLRVGLDYPYVPRLVLDIPTVGGTSAALQFNDMWTLGQWSHIALSYDRAAGRIRVFRDGIIRGEQFVGQIVPKTTDDLLWGSVHRLNGAPFRGAMDEIVIHRAPVAPEKLYAAYAAGVLGRQVPDGNRAPMVGAGPDLILPAVGAAALPGSVVDDGNPYGLPLISKWTMVDGPGRVTFSDATAAATQVSFENPGTYVLRLAGEDGGAVAAESMTARVGVTTALIPDGLVAWWPGNGDPTEALNGQHGLELINGAGYATGKIAQGFFFDGALGYGRVAAHPELDIGASARGMSIELWVKNEDAGGPQTFVQWGSNAQNGVTVGTRMHFGVPRLAATFYDTAGNTHLLQAKSGPLQLGVWEHLVFTYEKATGEAYVYRNGIIEPAEAFALGIFTPRTNLDLFVGSPHPLAPVRAAIDELSLYSRALFAPEVRALFAAGTGGKGPPDVNRPPVVSAGADLVLPGVHAVPTLHGVVTDDLLPFGPPAIQWSVVSGPGAVSFNEPTSAATTATFGSPGLYVLSLTANDLFAPPVVDLVQVRVGVTAVPAPVGLAAWWPLNGHVQEIAHGQSSFELINGPTFADGSVAQGLRFDGVDDAARTRADANLNIGASSSGFTIEFWVRPDAPLEADWPLLSWESLQKRGVEVVIGSFFSDRRADLVIRDQADVGHTLQGPKLNGRDGRWSHLAYTYDRSSGTARAYLDGNIITEINLGTNWTARTDTDLWLGSRRDNRKFKGAFDEVSLYARPLTSAEVRAIYQASDSGKFASTENAAPTVSAGPDIALVSPATTATLNGLVADDGKPFGTPALQWSAVIGPGAVTFGDATAAITTATFGTSGTYLLSLTGQDGLAPPVSDFTEVRVGAATVSTSSGHSAWWSANGHARELINGNHDLEFGNGAGYAPGKVLLGISLDGVDDFVRVPRHAHLDLGNATEGFTIEFWVKGDSYIQGSSLLSWHDSNSQGVDVGLTSFFGTRRVELALYDTAGGNRTVPGAVVSGREGQWIHLAYTYDRNTGIARAFDNGLIVSEASVGHHWTARTNLDVWIGSRSNQRQFKGTLDELSLYTRPLTYSEIGGIYRAGVDGKSNSAVNLPPTVDAGPDRVAATITSSVLLAGNVSDDNHPFGLPSLQWSKLAGPGDVVFLDGSTASTSATFGSPGLYLLQLSASDHLHAPVSDLVEVHIADSSVAVPSGVVAWWTGNGHSRDRVANQDLRLFNYPPFGTGRVLQALTFDGNAYGSALASPGLDVGGSATGFSIEFWLKNGVLGNNHPLIGWATSDKAGVQVLTANGFGTTFLQANIRDTAGGDHVINGPSIASSLGQWLHVGITFERATGAARFYYDGVAVATAHLGIGWTPQTAYDLWIGSLPGNRLFIGAIDEVTLYNRPLSAAEIASVCGAGADGKRPAEVNQDPIANAGPDKSTPVLVPVLLEGAATDDGLPNPPAALSYQWSKASGPGAVTFSTPTAASTMATFSLPGFYGLRLTVSDSERSHSDEATVNVVAPPVVAIIAPGNNSTHATNRPLTISAAASDADGTVATVEFFRNGTRLGEVLSPPYGFTLNPEIPPGSSVLTARATDNSGLTTTSAPVNINVVADWGTPFAEITAPAEDTRVTQPTLVTGIVGSPSLAGWSIHYRSKASDATPVEPWIQFGGGTTAVGTPPTASGNGLPGALGTFDPTRLINGIYEIQLRVLDSAGVSVVTGPQPLVVEGNMKVGAFSLAFEDLKLPLPGIPISVSRSYDSRDSRMGDFGQGWRLGLNNIRVQKNRHLGNGWWQTPQAGSGIQFYDVLPQRDRIVTIVMPDGETHRFKAGALVKNRVGDPDYRSFAVVVTQGKYRFYPVGDTTSTLEPLNGANQVVDDFYISGTNEQDLSFDPLGFEPFTTARYRLTTVDGTKLVVDEALGLVEMRDLNGNTLVLDRDASGRVIAVTSTGSAAGATTVHRITIARDSAGRIDFIRDPAGKEIDYIYDLQGRLEACVNREGNVTQYRYDNPGFPYYITRIIDPLGVSALRNEYDQAGKLVKQIDADGREKVFNRGVDTSGRFEQVTDRLGLTTKYYYNERGNVALKIDPAGAQTHYAYWPDSDRIKFETDHYGNVTSVAYDHQGNVIVQTVGANVADGPETPVSGHVTRTYYNSRGSPTQITDAEGRVQLFTYDAATNDLLTHTVGADLANPASGDRTTYTYHGDGSVSTITDALGNVTRHTYAHGLVDALHPNAVKSTTVTLTDPVGAAGSNPGNLTPTVVRSVRILYDAQENQVAKIITRLLPDGTSEDVVTRFVYDAENRLRAQFLPDGQVRETRYNASGRAEKTLQWKTAAEYGVLPRDDAKARVTAFVYDTRGNQIQVTHADGTTEAAAFDAEARRLWVQDRRGYRTYFIYDSLGRERFTIHPDGNDGLAGASPASPTDARLADNPRSETQYDLVGRVRFQIDARGAKTEFTYENGGGSARLRKQSVQHRAAGNLVTHFQYDRTGNVRSVTDPRGHTVETWYDAQSRPIRTIYPATDEHPVTQSEIHYDALGQRVTLIDQEGKFTRYAYDAGGRLIQVRQYLEAGLAASDADLMLSPGLAGIAATRFTYDALGNQQTQTDALGRTTTFWTDVAGRRTKRVLPKDPMEPVALMETLAYDDWGNLQQRTDFSGRTTTFGYDVLGRLISKRADPAHGSLSYSHAIARIEYDYDSGGDRLGARTYNAANALLHSESTPRDHRGRLARKDSASGRLDYGYYANGLLKDVVSANPAGVNIGYRYDEINRLEWVDDLSTGLPVRTTRYTYDANGSLATTIQPNSVVHSYHYDTVNRLRSLSVARAATGLHGYEYKLKRSGHRQQVVEGGRTTTYTYDELQRLTIEAIAGDENGNNGKVGYSLDKVGNRVTRSSQVPVLPAQLGLSYNSRDWLNGDAYTANGSTVSSVHFSTASPHLAGTDIHDFEERLILRTRADGTAVHVSYDADGNRIGKNILSLSGQLIASTSWLVDTNTITGYAQVVEEQNASTAGTARRIYSYGADLISQSMSTNAQGWEHRYFAYDGQGSTRELTDAAGAVTDRYDYDAFGLLIWRTGATANTYLYRGEQFDPDLGLYYLRARYLNPDSGRFWTMDGYEGQANDPASLHKYGYAAANPVSNFDPSGNYSVTDVSLTTFAIGVVVNIAAPTMRFLGAGEVAATRMEGFARVYNAALTTYFLRHPGVAGVMADEAAAGLQQLLTGRRQPTLIAQGAMAAGASWEMAESVSTGVQVGVSFPVLLVQANRLVAAMRSVQVESWTATSRTWNEFQKATAGQFASRTEASQAWTIYKASNGIEIGVRRSVGARSEYLRNLSDDWRTPSSLKEMLSEGRVPQGYQVDHIRPLSVGGDDVPSNMRLQSTDLHRIHHKFYDPWNW